MSRSTYAQPLYSSIAGLCLLILVGAACKLSSLPGGKMNMFEGTNAKDGAAKIKAKVGSDPLKEDQLGCTASAKTTLLQVRDPLPERAVADADEVLYVVAGEGTLRLGNRDVPLSATTLAIVPRGTVRALTRRGRNPLILLSTVSGPPCTK